MSKLYYTPPEDKYFDELKAKAIELWTERYPEATSPYYAKEKVGQIRDIKNVSDNFMYMVAMMDIVNQRLLAHKLTVGCRRAVYDRMVDGGQPEEFNVF